MFIDDVLIYSRDLEEHAKHLVIVLEILQKARLYAKFSKYEFWIKHISFIGHIVSVNRVFVDPAKVEAVVKWGRRNTVTKIKSFSGLARYYCRFVKGFLSIATPLTRLTKKNIKFQWDDECDISFNELKQKLTTAPMLTIPSGEGGYAVQ